MPNNYIASVTLYSNTPYPNQWPYACGLNSLNKSTNRMLNSDGQQILT